MVPERPQRQMQSLRRVTKVHRDRGSEPMSSGIVASSIMRRWVSCPTSSGSSPAMPLEDITRECTCDNSTPTLYHRATGSSPHHPCFEFHRTDPPVLWYRAIKALRSLAGTSAPCSNPLFPVWWGGGMDQRVVGYSW